MLLLEKNAVNLLSVSVRIRIVFTRVWFGVPAREVRRNGLNWAIAEDNASRPSQLNSQL